LSGFALKVAAGRVWDEGAVFVLRAGVALSRVASRGTFPVGGRRVVGALRALAGARVERLCSGARELPPSVLVLATQR
jgi:hypothetical protein